MFEYSVEERQHSIEESFSEKIEGVATKFSTENHKIETELKANAD